MVQNFRPQSVHEHAAAALHAALFGSGTATATFTAVPNDDGQGHTLFDVQSLTYPFDATPSPTPEPSSLVLLGTDVAGRAARKWRRR